MKILVTGKPRWFDKDSHTAISFYRIIYPLKELARNVPGLEIIESISGTMPDLAGVDVVFLHTPTTQDAINAIANAEAAGKKVWLDFDDLVFDDSKPPKEGGETVGIPRANVAWTFFNAKNNKKAVRLAVNSASIISVSSEMLKTKLVELFDVIEEKIHVIPNALPDAVWARRSAFTPVIRESKRILWRGSVTHNGDLLLYRNAWKPIKNIQYGFFGSLPWMLEKQYGGHLSENDYGLQQWDKNGMFSYFETLKSMNPHYIVTPLEKCDFNRAKSNISWLEGTLAGAACIVNEGMPEFPDSCVKFSTPKSLNRIFEQIGKGEDLRTENYMKSRAIIEEKYLLSVTNKKRFNIINSL